MEQALKDAEESIRLAKYMGIDTTAQEMKLSELKKRYQEMKDGFEKYLRERGITV